MLIVCRNTLTIFAKTDYDCNNGYTLAGLANQGFVVTLSRVSCVIVGNTNCDYPYRLNQGYRGSEYTTVKEGKVNHSLQLHRVLVLLPGYNITELGIRVEDFRNPSKLIKPEIMFMYCIKLYISQIINLKS